jgi:8-oxo-dGTP diphosphatase
LEQALGRELSEEIGVVPTAFAFLIQLGDQQSSLDRAITFHLFCVDDWKGEPRLLGDEHSELRWVDLRMAASLPDLALPSYSTVFEMLLRR